METKHTPGPWIAHEGAIFQEKPHGEVSPLICDTINGRKFTGEERGANARLIAAAPELLEALMAQKKWQSLQDAYNAMVLGVDERDTKSVDDMDRAWDEFLDARIKADWLLDAAIAKATGKAL